MNKYAYFQVGKRGILSHFENESIRAVRAAVFPEAEFLSSLVHFMRLSSNGVTSALVDSVNT